MSVRISLSSHLLQSLVHSKRSKLSIDCVDSWVGSNAKEELTISCPSCVFLVFFQMSVSLFLGDSTILFSYPWPGLTQTSIEHSLTSLLASDPHCHSGTTFSVPLPINQAFPLFSEQSASTFAMLFFLENSLLLKEKWKLLNTPCTDPSFPCRN